MQYGRNVLGTMNEFLSLTVLTLANEAVHLSQRDLVVVEAAVFEKAPELHASHGEGVVRALLVPQLAVVVVDLAQTADVSRDHIQHLHADTQNSVLICCMITYSTYIHTRTTGHPVTLSQNRLLMCHVITYTTYIQTHTTDC